MRILTAIALLLFANMAVARDLAMPQGDVLLTVTGAIENTNADGAAAFDRSMIEALAQRDTTTKTPWFDTERTFSGPLGHAILDAVGATGKTLRIYALNEYSADVLTQDFRDHAVILATHIDGSVIRVRDKGPLFLIYPFNEVPELFNEVYFGRSVWQIARIEVID
ncbi:MAG: hypothetical protein HKP54_06935 [Boseongicola sp.]|nr:hypothetical protein [Boseongicola sp.]